MMKNVMFLSRVAFIFNLCMVIGLSMRYVDLLNDQIFQATIIIAGFVLSFITNILAVAGVLIILSRKENTIKLHWLFVINFLFLIFQLYFFLK